MIKKNYTYNNGPSYLKIPTDMFDNKYFSNWLGTFEAKVWFRIFRHAVRGEMFNLNKKIYDNYYGKGKVCAYQSLKDISMFLGMRSISPISDAIRSMIEKNIIIPHKDAWNRRSITIYEVATHDGGPSRHENLHLLIYSTKLKAQKELEKMFFISGHFGNTELATSEIPKPLIIE